MEHIKEDLVSPCNDVVLYMSDSGVGWGVVTTLVVTLCMRGIKPCNDHSVYYILKAVLCTLEPYFLCRTGYCKSWCHL